MMKCDYGADEIYASLAFFVAINGSDRTPTILLYFENSAKIKHAANAPRIASSRVAALLPRIIHSQLTSSEQLKTNLKEQKKLRN